MNKPEDACGLESLGETRTWVDSALGRDGRCGSERLFASRSQVASPTTRQHPSRLSSLYSAEPLLHDGAMQHTAGVSHGSRGGGAKRQMGDSSLYHFHSEFPRMPRLVRNATVASAS